MIETETESSWKIEEELTDGGERTLFVRIPKVEIVPPTVAIQIRRPNEPPFLTSDGWGSEAEALVPDSVVRDGGDLLLAIPSEYAVWIDDFEPIEVALEGTDVVGALPWVIEPHVKIGGDDSEDSEEINVKPTAIPHVRISTSKSMVLVGSNVELQWESENADSVAAIGDWSGDLGVSGMKEIQVSKPGENVFSLVAHGASDNGKDSVKVTGIPRWLIVLAITLVTIILLGLILWFVVKQQNPQEGTTQEGTTQEGTTQEGTTQEAQRKKAQRKKAQRKKAQRKKARLKKARLKKARLKKARLKKARLKKARLKRARLKETRSLALGHPVVVLQGTSIKCFHVGNTKKPEPRSKN